MPINHKTNQLELPWGKNAFESYAMKYSPDPQMIECCGCMQIDGMNAQIISIGRDAPIITYEGDPVLLMSLSNCECFVNYQQGSNLIVIMAENKRPMQSMLQTLNPEVFQELLYQLSVLYDIEDCQAIEVLNKRNIAAWTLYESFKTAVNAGTVTIDQLLQGYQALVSSGEPLFFFEQQLVNYLEKAKASDQNTALKLLENAPLFMFMERFGNAPGQVILLDRHSPLILGKGDYMVFESFTQTEQLVGRESNFVKFCSALFTTPEAFKFDFEASKIAAGVERQGTFIKSQQNEVTMERNIIHVKIQGSHLFSIQFHYNHGQDVELGDQEQHTTFCQFIGSVEINGAKQIVPTYVTLQPGEKAVCQLKTSFQEGELALLVLQYQ